MADRTVRGTILIIKESGVWNKTVTVAIKPEDGSPALSLWTDMYPDTRNLPRFLTVSGIASITYDPNTKQITGYSV